MSTKKRDLSPPREVKPIILGILGTRSEKIIASHKINIASHILNLILQELGRLPDKVLVPAEGYSSMFIQSWAESLKIRDQVFYADWKENGKSAAILRDARIVNEATHLLVFLSPRSTRLEKIAEKAAILKKNPKIVITSSYQDSSLELLVPTYDPPPSLKEHDHKSDSGTEQQHRLKQTLLDSGNP